ncbi:hypothetical protein MP638_004932 [Amoeboaphelidium occidentale]|nr:hypothetical protein MP638_004932 [Amoeboaphelidium occidentale]
MEAIDKKDAVDIFANVPSCSEVTVRRMSKRKREETAEQSNQFYVRKGTFRKTMIKRIISFLIPSFKKQGRERLAISDLETAYRTGNSVLPSSLDRKRDNDSSEYDHVIVHGLGLAAHEAVQIALELKTKYPQEVSIGNITTSTENMQDTIDNIQNGERSEYEFFFILSMTAAVTTFENLPIELVQHICMFLDDRKDMISLIRSKGRLFLCLYDVSFVFRWHVEHGLLDQFQNPFKHHYENNPLLLKRFLAEYWKFNNYDRVSGEAIVRLIGEETELPLWLNTFVTFCLRKVFNDIVIEVMELINSVNIPVRVKCFLLQNVIQRAQDVCNLRFLRLVYRKIVNKNEIYSGLVRILDLFRHANDTRKDRLIVSMNKQVEWFIDCSDQDLVYDGLYNAVSSGVLCTRAYYHLFMVVSLDDELYKKFSGLLLIGLDSCGVTIEDRNFQYLVENACTELKFPRSDILLKAFEFVVRFRGVEREFQYLLEQLDENNLILDEDTLSHIATFLGVVEDNSGMLTLWFNHCERRGGLNTKHMKMLLLQACYHAKSVQKLTLVLKFLIPVFSNGAWLSLGPSKAFEQFCSNLAEEPPDWHLAYGLISSQVRSANVPKLVINIFEATARADYTCLKQLAEYFVEYYLIDLSANINAESVETLEVVHRFCKRRMVDFKTQYFMNPFTNIREIGPLEQLIRIEQEIDAPRLIHYLGESKDSNEVEACRELCSKHFNRLNKP